MKSQHVFLILHFTITQKEQEELQAAFIYKTAKGGGIS